MRWAVGLVPLLAVAIACAAAAACTIGVQPVPGGLAGGPQEPPGDNAGNGGFGSVNGGGKCPARRDAAACPAVASFGTGEVWVGWPRRGVDGVLEVIARASRDAE
jgi:hypothetical protein